MNTEEIIKNIEPTKYYTVKAIADNGWILNKLGEKAKTRLDYIYKVIRRGSLPAKDVSILGKKKNHQYLVRGLDIIDFMRIYAVHDRAE